MRIRKDTEWNYSYFPVIFKTEKELLKVLSMLGENEIYPRRYFYPSLNNLPYVDHVEMPISDSIAKRILCLPLYYGLSESNIKKICNLIKTAIC